MSEFFCEACGETFEKQWTDDESQAEAERVFRPEELVLTAIVCHDCWQQMLVSNPDLEQRYREASP